jgi:hypothetical protein
MKFGEEINDWGNHQITSVKDLIGIMDSNLYSKKSRWIYRGQANIEWKIIPSIGRLFGTKNFTSKAKLYKYEKDSFSEFYIRNFSDFREKNKISNLAIAQHHGLKTRLIDWTFSPLYSLFLQLRMKLNIIMMV